MSRGAVTIARQEEGRSGSAASWRRSIAIAVGGGLVVGALTSIGQGALPDEVRSLANGSAPWSAAAFVLAVVAGRRETFRSSVLAAAALLAMLAGYSLMATLRGFPVGPSMTLFWVAAAVVAGPVLGVGAAWSQGTDRPKAAAGVAILASILVGEAVYGLSVIAGSTSPAYWTAQLVVGLGLVAVLGYHLRSWAGLVLCAALSAAGAAAFAFLYSNLTGLA
jgi:hypothetical protein